MKRLVSTPPSIAKSNPTSTLIPLIEKEASRPFSEIPSEFQLRLKRLFQRVISSELPALDVHDASLMSAIVATLRTGNWNKIINLVPTPGFEASVIKLFCENRITETELQNLMMAAASVATPWIRCEPADSSKKETASHTRVVTMSPISFLGQNDLTPEGNRLVDHWIDCFLRIDGWQGERGLLASDVKSQLVSALSNRPWEWMAWHLKIPKHGPTQFYNLYELFSEIPFVNRYLYHPPEDYFSASEWVLPSPAILYEILKAIWKENAITGCGVLGKSTPMDIFKGIRSQGTRDVALPTRGITGFTTIHSVDVGLAGQIMHDIYLHALMATCVAEPVRMLVFNTIDIINELIPLPERSAPRNRCFISFRDKLIDLSMEDLLSVSPITTISAASACKKWVEVISDFGGDPTSQFFSRIAKDMVINPDRWRFRTGESVTDVVTTYLDQEIKMRSEWVDFGMNWTAFINLISLRIHIAVAQNPDSADDFVKVGLNYFAQLQATKTEIKEIFKTPLTKLGPIRRVIPDLDKKISDGCKHFISQTTSEISALGTNKLEREALLIRLQVFYGLCELLNSL